MRIFNRPTFRCGTCGKKGKGRLGPPRKEPDVRPPTGWLRLAGAVFCSKECRDRKAEEWRKERREEYAADSEKNLARADLRDAGLL